MSEAVCAECGELKRMLGRGLCGACYMRRKRAGDLRPVEAECHGCSQTFTGRPGRLYCSDECATGGGRTHRAGRPTNTTGLPPRYLYGRKR